MFKFLRSVLWPRRDEPAGPVVSPCVCGMGMPDHHICERSYRIVYMGERHFYICPDCKRWAGGFGSAESAARDWEILMVRDLGAAPKVSAMHDQQ